MANGLTAQDFQGLSPDQIAQTRALGQQDRQQDIALAKALADQKRQRIQQKMQAVGMAIDAKMQERKNQLAERRVDAYDRMVRAQELQSEAAYLAQKRKYEELSLKQKRLEKYKSMKIETNLGELPLMLVKTLQENGAPIKAYGGDKVLDTWQDAEGNVAYTVQRNDGSIEKTDTIEGLTGFDKAADRTEVRMGPGERAEETARGRQRAEVTSAEWLEDRKAELTEDTNYLMLENSPKEEDRRKAQMLLRQKVKNDLWSTYSDRANAQDVVYADGPKGRGFYLIREDKKPQFIRGDVK